QLLAECAQYMQAGRLIEARQKALEAQALRLPFGPDEDSPEQALLMLSSVCYKQVVALMDQAAQLSSTGAAEAVQRAEQQLAQAQQLARGFGLDTQPIDVRVAALRRQRGGEVAANTPAAPAAPGVGAAMGPAGVSTASANAGQGDQG